MSTPSIRKVDDREKKKNMGGGGGGRKLMLEIMATKIVASQPPERQLLDCLCQKPFVVLLMTLSPVRSQRMIWETQLFLFGK